MEPILQSALPQAPWMEERTRRLPGVVPLAYADWLQVDDAYGAQLAYKAQLLRDRRETVLQMRADALPAAQELLELALAHAPEGIADAPIDRDAPLETLSRLFQEDFVILQKQGDRHILTAALLCFPASWSLAEKFGKPLTAIHDPVPEYDAAIARSVERMFTVLRPEQPLMRMNALVYADPDLHHPQRGSDIKRAAGHRGFIRSERQCMVRLPTTGAAMFSIHTYLVREADLTPAQADSLAAHPIIHEGF
ncbi:uncharacterized protein DUF3445 [Litoreibacter ponti]|uniref:Uncharacterized protein DUF3445 n=1 Tax=Litoreibacter ponti TaxID=1510457 RepID=A0A2T6BI68_9RHOB|nr:DUF3445 domain-containing protein [Litoreibacter ponti]PTX55763.1 uncharacterized protein DUF3445 [Litoreibacter ponti]